MTADPFPLHVELACRQFALYRNAKGRGDVRAMRFHLDKAREQFRSVDEVLVEAADALVLAEMKIKEGKS